MTKKESEMGKIVDYNVTEEIEHGVYVSCLVRELTRELHVDEAVSYQLRLAGLLHDIGKLRLTSYLNGEAELTSPLIIEEMKYVRLHSILSYEIVKERHFSPIVLESIRYHHENYDGSGYPSNLMGDEIPFGARIIRICDVFAALTTDRPYRKHFSPEEAISLMIDEIPHFDMEIFLAFQRVAHRVGSSYLIALPDADPLIHEHLKSFY